MKILFVDIETVAQTNNFESYSRSVVWTERYCSKLEEGETPEDKYKKSAPLYAEFGKVACISIGYYEKQENGEEKFVQKTQCGEDEVEMLNNFNSLLDRIEKLCGHNIKQFDIPFLWRRMIINGIKPHKKLWVGDVKPWELTHIIDTMEIWKMTGGVSTSLEVLCYALGIPNPKIFLKGSQVNDLYWSDDPDRFEIIKKYCEKDVLATAECYDAIISKKA